MIQINKIGLSLCMLSLLLCKPTLAKTAIKDISPNDAAYKSIKNVVDSGLMSVYSDGNFYGDRMLTRQEVAIILDNILKRIDNEGEQLTRTDIQQLTRLSKTFKSYLSDLELTQVEYGEDLRFIKDEQVTLHHDLTQLTDQLKIEKQNRGSGQSFLLASIFAAALVGIFL